VACSLSDELAFGSGEMAVRKDAEPVSRGMAVRAMAGPIHDRGATVPRVGSAFVRNEGTGREEEGFPDAHGEVQLEW
jgi:hypothetical protein